jgi:glycerate kinase
MGEKLRVLVATDSFKGSAKSGEVCEAIKRGWVNIRPSDELTLIPVADGGEGTLEAIEARISNTVKVFINVELVVGSQREAYWLLLPDGTAIVELAQACGIELFSKLSPLEASTYAFGQLLKSAIEDSRVRRIFATVGGSASTDGGAGALSALGAQFFNGQEKLKVVNGGNLKNVTHVNISRMIKPHNVPVTCLVDVKNPLTGESGAAFIFGPQKGANSDEVQLLAEGLENFKKITGLADFVGAGAAGGTSFGLTFGWNSEIEFGADKICELSGINEVINKIDIVITGEGKFDHQSLNGKITGVIVKLAQEQKKRPFLCVGSTEIEFSDFEVEGISLIELSGDQEEAMNKSIYWLEKAGERLAEMAS